MTKLIYTVTLLGAITAVSALPDSLNAVQKREPLGALPQNADNIELSHQPYMDFDTDGCYQTSAVDINGKLNNGLPREHGLVSGGCRDPSRLQNSNTYSRRRCNNGVCGIIYAYYYEKDAATNVPIGAVGHTHDWEHVVSFTGSKGELLGAAVSQHKGYEVRKAGQFFTSKDGKHPIAVYHKDGASTHCHRFANQDDINHYENFSGNSWRAALVGWFGWPQGLRDAVLNRNWGDAQIAINDKNFGANLEKAGARQFGLDPYGPDN